MGGGPRILAAAFAAWLLAIEAGCAQDTPAPGGLARPESAASEKDSSGARGRSGPAAESAEVVIDGSFGDWRGPARLRADDRDLLVRLSLPESTNLQAGVPAIALLLDLDDDPRTGSSLEGVTGDAGGGAELAVVFSPPGTGRGGGQGAAALVLPSSPGDGAAQPLAHAALDLVFAPTYAARDFEMRLSRRIDGPPALSEALMRGRVSARVLAVDASRWVAWSESLGSVELPPLAPAQKAAAVTLPPRRADALRVVSWNVLFASPKRNPAPFARILRALDPDIVLVQEWEKADAPALVDWFAAHVSPNWHALTSSGWGVAVIARGAMERLTPESIARPEEAPPDDFRPDQALRLAAGIVQTRVGKVAAASMHFKCCGAAGGREDRARIAEARRVQEMLAASLASGEPVLRVFGGDLNLVGSRLPLDILRTGLASGGGDLRVAQTAVAGDRAWYTWRRAGSRFAPGRLDFLLFGGARSVAAFAVDTARLPPSTLDALGLEPGDSAASDHLALVLDLEPSTAPFARTPP